MSSVTVTTTAVAGYRGPKTRLMLNLCNLIRVGDMPSEDRGQSLAEQPSRNEMLRYVFESFVGDFYSCALILGWTRRET